ncbi:MAG: beta strand repeat-containing protein [Roseiarcus sp.]
MNGTNTTLSDLTGYTAVTNNGASSAVLTINGDTTTTFLGTIQNGTSTTGLTLTGAGTDLTLSGISNTYSGATTVGDGTTASMLTGGALDAFSAASATTVTTNSVLNLGGYDQAIGSLSGAGTVTLGSNTLTITGGGGSFGGDISGSGGLTLNASGGTQTLTAANGYTGATTITAGTLALSGNGSIADSSGVTDNGTFSISGANSGASIVSLSGTGGVTLGSNTLTITGTGGSFGGDISGNGGLTLNASGGTQTLTGTNGYTGATTITAGTLALSGNGSIADSSGVTDNGTFSISGANSGASIVSLSGTGGVTLGSNTLTITGTGGSFGGDISGAGGLTLNASGGTQTLTGTNGYTGATTITAGTLALSSTGSITASSSLTNSGTFTVASGGSATFTSVTNKSDGTIINDGTITDDLNNAGTVTNNGAYNATVATNTGTITNSATGTWTGNVTSNASNATGITNSGIWIGNVVSNTGTLVNNLTWTGTISNAATFDNNAGGTVSGLLTNTAGTTTNAGQLNGGATVSGGTLTTTGTIAGGLTNSATVNAQGTIDGAISNSGQFNVTGALTNNGSTFNNTSAGTLDLKGNSFTGLGAVTNSGTIVMNQATQTLGATSVTNSGLITTINGNVVTNVATIAGGYVGSGGQIDLAASLVNTSAVRANVVDITGAASGTTTIVLTNVGNSVLFSTPIPLINVSGAVSGSPFVLSAADAGGGLISYSIVQESAGHFDLVSNLNVPSLASVGGGVGAAITSATTGFFQGASAFVSTPQNAKPNQVDGGVWMRSADGVNTDRSTAQLAIGTATSSSSLQTETHFAGVQVGSDLGVFNIQNSGWNAHAGVTGGEYDTSSSEQDGSATTSNFRVPFVGIYGALSGYGFFADAQIRHDSWYGDVSNATAGLANARLDGEGFAASTSMGYNYRFDNGFFVEPSAGFSYTRATFNSLTVLPGSASNNQLAVGPVVSDLGRLGLRFGDTWMEGAWALQPYFVTSVWHEFAGSIPGEFTQSTTGQPTFTAPLTVSRVGTFGQFGLGVSAQILNTGWSGFVRGDYRTGEEIRGSTITGGLRYQF